MRVLMLSEPTYPQHPGGTGKSAHLQAAGLVARGHEVFLVSNGEGKPAIEHIEGVHVHRVGLPGDDALLSAFWDRARSRALLEYIEREIPLGSIDVVHDSAGFLSYIYPVLHRLRQAHGLPVVVQFHLMLHRTFVRPSSGRKSLRFARTLRTRPQCFPVRLADLVLCLSQEDARLVESLYRPMPGQLDVIYNPVDLRLYSRRASRRRRLQYARPGEFLLLFGGRVDDSAKGFKTVANALMRMNARSLRVRCLLLADVPERQMLEPLGDAIIPIGWQRDARSVAEVLGAADAIVLPSRYESFGLLAAEAMAAGVPVIASATGALPELITHGENGFLLQGQDDRSREEELVEYVLRLINEPELHQRLGANARLRARRSLCVEFIASRLEALYLRAIRNKVQRGAASFTLPLLTLEDRQHYLKLLGSLAGPEACAAGEKTLGGWKDSVDARCQECNFGRLARGGLSIAEASPGALEQVVGAMCPLGLLQIDSLGALD